MQRALWACTALLAATATSSEQTSLFTLKALSAPSANQVAVLDLNGDELSDLFLTTKDGSGQLLLQQTSPGGEWTRRPLSLQPSDPSTRTDTALAIDVNRDFIPDVVLVRGGRVQLLLNTGQAGLRDATPKNLRATDGAMTRSVTVVDVNGDGWIDVYEGRHRSGKSGTPGRLWLNTGKLQNGVPQFRDSTAASGLSADHDVIQASFLDLDNDGDQDLVTLPEPGSPRLWENLGQNRFRQRRIEALDAKGTYRTLAAADYDNDGYVDLFFTADSGHPLLLRNHGGLRFNAVPAGVDKAVGSAAAWVDVDNDGLLDLVVAGQNSRVFRQITGGFVETDAGLPPAEEIVVADVDRNGFADLVLLQTQGLTTALNRGGAHHWLSVRLRARNNASTLGAKAVVYLADGTHLTKQNSASGRMSHDHELLFGIGRRTQIEGVRIYWPSGKFTQREDVGIDRHIGFVEPSDAAGGKNVHQRLPQIQLWKKPRSPILLCK